MHLQLLMFCFRCLAAQIEKTKKGKFANILRHFNVLTIRHYYLQTWYMRVVSRVSKRLKSCIVLSLSIPKMPLFLKIQEKLQNIEYIAT